MGLQDTVLDEYKGAIDGSMTCMLCQADLGTRAEALRLHFLFQHAVELPHVRLLRDMHGLLRVLEGIIFHEEEADSTERIEWHCPVCRTSTGTDADALLLHVAAAHHQRWNRHSVPGLTEFYTDGAASSSDSEDVRDPICEGDEAASDEEGDWDEIPEIQCLYCSYRSDNCLEHMITVHGFDLQHVTSHRADVRDEYDLIRLVNDVRRSVAEGKCPYGVNEGTELPLCTHEPPSTEGVHRVSLEEHFRAHPTHRVPHHISTGDAALIPVLPEDALLSHLMTAGGGFLPEEQADPDFPVVPTILQLAERRRKANPQPEKQH